MLILILAYIASRQSVNNATFRSICIWGVLLVSQTTVFNLISAGVDASASATGKVMFKCPLPTHGRGRGDRRPSAELFEDEKGKIGVVCYAGCDNRELWTVAVAPYLDTVPGAGRQGRDNADDNLIAVYQHPDNIPRKIFRQDCLVVRNL